MQDINGKEGNDANSPRFVFCSTLHRIKTAARSLLLFLFLVFFFVLSVRWSPSFAFPDCILPIVRCCWTTDQNRLMAETEGISLNNAHQDKLNSFVKWWMLQDFFAGLKAGKNWNGFCLEA